MPRFKSNIFHYNSPQLKLFLQNFRALGFSPRPSCLRQLGALPLDPQLLMARVFAPQTPKIAPPIANFWIRAWFGPCLGKIDKISGLIQACLCFSFRCYKSVIESNFATLNDDFDAHQYDSCTNIMIALPYHLSSFSSFMLTVNEQLTRTNLTFGRFRACSSRSVCNE